MHCPVWAVRRGPAALLHVSWAPYCYRVGGFSSAQPQPSFSLAVSVQRCFPSHYERLTRGARSSYSPISTPQPPPWPCLVPAAPSFPIPGLHLAAAAGPEAQESFPASRAVNYLIVRVHYRSPRSPRTRDEMEKLLGWGDQSMLNASGTAGVVMVGGGHRAALLTLQRMAQARGLGPCLLPIPGVGDSQAGLDPKPQGSPLQFASPGQWGGGAVTEEACFLLAPCRPLDPLPSC